MKTNIEKNLPEKIWNLVKGKKRYLRGDSEGYGGRPLPSVENLSFGLNGIFLSVTVSLHELSNKTCSNEIIVLYLFNNKGK